MDIKEIIVDVLVKHGKYVHKLTQSDVVLTCGDIFDCKKCPYNYFYNGHNNCAPIRIRNIDENYVPMIVYNYIVEMVKKKSMEYKEIDL